MRRDKVKRKLRDVVIIFCEGETEITLFAFLKGQYSNKRIEFKKPIDLKGLTDLADFKRKYNKQIKAQGLKPKKDYSSVRFLFIIDNDLPDSEKIKDFLEKEGHLVLQFEPNPEGWLLNAEGKNQGHNLKTEDFRKKCKVNFKNHFGCEAHRLKEKKLKEIFNKDSIMEDNFKVLYDLFRKE